ncbi:MAG: DUF3127 domain-containing protein [Prevotella sp.]|nr:DUF3127 domain-containing protein [Prevotella sp.]
MEIEGKIIFALEPKTGTSARGEWKVQEFVLETLDGQFSRKMVFSVFGEERLQRFNIQVGQDVKVSFDIDAREYNGRWFNSIRAFDVRPATQQAPTETTPPPFDNPFNAAAGVAPQQPATATPQQPADSFANSDESSDDLPF